MYVAGLRSLRFVALTSPSSAVYIADLPGKAAGEWSEQAGDYGHGGNRNTLN